MSDTLLPSGEILELIKGQARLETKLDQFFVSQAAMRTEMDGLKADIASTKADVSEIKSRIRSATAYVTALSAVFGIAWMLVGDYFSSAIKKIFVQ